MAHTGLPHPTLLLISLAALALEASSCRSAPDKVQLLATKLLVVQRKTVGSATK